MKKITDKQIGNLLLDLGIAPNCKGFNDTIIAVKLINTNPTYLHNLVYGLYADVSKTLNNGDTIISVERNIRHVLEQINTNSEIYSKIFRNVKKLTTGKFLSCIWFYLLQN